MIPHSVSVDALWSEVLRHVAGDDPDAVRLVVPSWWTPTRVRRVAAAAERTYPDVSVLRRRDALHTNEADALVEIARELIAIFPPGAATELVPRIGDDADVADKVLGRLGTADGVVIDAPTGVDATELVDDLTCGLAGRGVSVTVTDDAAVAAAAGVEFERRWPVSGRRWLRRLSRPRVIVAAAAVLSVTALVVAGLRHEQEATRGVALTWLVEGRVAVEVPADWSTERIVVGPGSARVQVMSPVDPYRAIHITQSPIPRGQSLVAAAEVVRTALGEQPDGVFGGFDPAGRVGGQPAITYRETRSDRVVDWTLVLDGGVRIAIGCQRAPDRTAPDAVCEHTIRSAHEWG